MSSDDILRSDGNKAREIADYMNRNPSLRVGIDGSSARRVANVRDALINAGVPAYKIQPLERKARVCRVLPVRRALSALRAFKAWPEARARKARPGLVRPARPALLAPLARKAQPELRVRRPALSWQAWPARLAVPALPARKARSVRLARKARVRRLAVRLRADPLSR